MIRVDTGWDSVKATDRSEAVAFELRQADRSITVRSLLCTMNSTGSADLEAPLQTVTGRSTVPASRLSHSGSVRPAIEKQCELTGFERRRRPATTRCAPGYQEPRRDYGAARTQADAI